MDVDFIFKQIQHMTPSSFSVREERCYQAEKMLMRQFMLMKEREQVPTYLSTKDLKAWVLSGRSFLEEYQEIANRADARKLLVAELEWTSARQRCLDHMEKELQEELEKEKQLSLQLRREVTLEGLQLFLSVLRPKIEQDASTLLYRLSSKLLSSFTGSHTSNRSKLALLIRLRWTITPLANQVVDIALKFLLDPPQPPQAGGSSSTCPTRLWMKAASAEIGKLLAATAAACFCMNTRSTKAQLLHICTAVAIDWVRVISKRFADRSQTFHLMDYDESFSATKEFVHYAIHDMDKRARRAAHREAPHPLCTEGTPEVCCTKAAESADEKEDKAERQGVKALFIRMWRKMKRLPTEQ